MANANKHLRAKHLKLTTSEDQVKEIVTPLVDFTAYCLGITHLSELPEPKTMRVSIDSSKKVLARLMSNKLARVVNSAELNSVTLEVFSHAGYFKIRLIETVGFIHQPFNLTLSGISTLPLIMKVKKTMENKHPEASDEQHAHMAIAYTKGL